MTEHNPPVGASHLMAASLAAGGQTRVLKHADTFVVLDQYGDIRSGGLGEEGLYHEGTRFLSVFALDLQGARPFYLDSAITLDNNLLVVTLTNPDLITSDGVRLPLATLHVECRKFLWRGVLYQQATVTNHGRDPAAVVLGMQFAADYSDIFEVRAPHRGLRGRDLEPAVTPDRVTLHYEGRDGVRRSTHLSFDPEPKQLSAMAARYHLKLDPHQPVTVLCNVACDSTSTIPRRLTFHAARAEAALDVTQREARECRIETSHAQTNAWIDRARADLRTLTTDLPTGPYPYAGVPWFNTPFGRDGLITAWQSLWLQPALARGVLSFLAVTQATDVIAERDAEPGKIVHETRAGELAALGEIPFGRYYGSVDSTPLFVALAGAYLARTGDEPFVRSIWASIEAALEWIDTDGDRDGDGFVEYERRTPVGLLHQGWKDGDDGVMHEDGSMAAGPIALCEVQGYVHAAWRAAAMLARRLGDDGRAKRWDARATLLRQSFDRAFWCESLGAYALALDGRKAPCRVRTSNAGQCLFGGIVRPDRARVLAHTLLGADCFSGWGIRTLAAGGASYNPMGYHTGGIWPHDNALIAEGLATYGMSHEAGVILQSQFEASLHFDQQRMPELFCGFDRRPGDAPVPYPLACAPQAWAAGAVLLLLKASLGVQIDAIERRVVFTNPRLPAWLDRLSIFNLEMGDDTIDLAVVRHGRGVRVTVLRNAGSVRILRKSN